jgi:hypothetical protein
MLQIVTNTLQYLPNGNIVKILIIFVLIMFHIRTKRYIFAVRYKRFLPKTRKKIT